MQIAGRRVLLTGATGGLGHAIARRLSGAGAELVLTGRRTDVLEPLAVELGARSLAVDLSDLAAVAALAEDAADCDVLVANAALPGSGHLLGFSPEEIDRALTVNLHAPILLARLMAERLVAAGRGGHLVFISSLSGKAGAPGSSIYSATKFGLRGFAQSVREDLRDDAIGVSTVFPGFIRDAGMFVGTGVELPRGVRTKTPEEVAAAVATAIERNRNEIDVAPLDLRLGAALSGIAPELAARVSRRLGSQKISEQMAEGHARNPRTR